LLSSLSNSMLIEYFRLENKATVLLSGVMLSPLLACFQYINSKSKSHLATSKHVDHRAEASSSLYFLTLPPLISFTREPLLSSHQIGLMIP
jgi:hypothetical protein